MSGQRLNEGSRIWRFTVPVDDEWHTLTPVGELLAVAGRDATHDVVEFWACGDGVVDREFRVIGTGQPMPACSRYWGTIVATPFVVWHLIERWPAS